MRNRLQCRPGSDTDFPAFSANPSRWPATPPRRFRPLRSAAGRASVDADSGNHGSLRSNAGPIDYGRVRNTTMPVAARYRQPLRGWQRPRLMRKWATERAPASLAAALRRQPGRTQRHSRSGVNRPLRGRFNITPHSAKSAQSLRCASLGGPTSRNRRYVWRPSPSAKP